LLWNATDLGIGYSSASVANGVVYVTGRKEDQGYLTALDLEGNVLWALPYGEETRKGQAAGARSTPTVDDSRVYVLSGPGLLTCFDIEKRAPRWSVDVMDRFEGKEVSWSLSESVLIDGDRVFCTPGGPDASVVALDKMTGETLWTSKGLSEASAYCSPDMIEHGGRKLLITMTALSVVALDPETGALLWTHPHPTDYEIHAVTPVYADGMLYYTAGYKSGGGLLALSADGASVTPKWSDENLDCQHHGVVLDNGYIYSTSHKSSELMCLEFATGKVMWRTEEVTQGSIVLADGMLYVYEGPKAGVVSLVKATPDGFQRVGQFEITEGSSEHWAHPTIAGKRLYIRRGADLFVYDIAAS